MAKFVYVGPRMAQTALSADEWIAVVPGAEITALDRASGRPLGHYGVQKTAAGPRGFPGSSAVGGDLVFFTGLDGHVYAFKQ